MKQMSRLQRTSQALLLAIVLLIMAAAMASGQGGVTFVAGEIILYCRPGTPHADVEAMSALVKADSLRDLLLKDCYVLELPADKRDDMNTLAAVATLKADPRVRYVKASPLYKLRQTTPTVMPNDPRIKEQWGLTMIRMPQAWTLQKGAKNTNVSVIDSGFDPKHEDYAGQLDPGSFDEADNDSDVTADGSAAGGGVEDHGQFCSGIINAITNNGIGIAGVCWENVKNVGLKIQKKGNANLDGPAIMNSYAYLIANAKKLNVKVVNMSYGREGGDPTDANAPDYVALKALADQGIILVSAAGNANKDNTNDIPSGFSFVISVGSVGPSARKASYSSFDKVELAAPGGDQAADNDPNGILSTKFGSKYAFEQGTSFASPHVAAVAALLMSVQGVTAPQAIQAMYTTANRTGLALSKLPDPVYGFGIVDAYAALLKVSVRAIILDPVGIDGQGNTTDPTGIAPPVETFKPKLRFEISNAKLDDVTIRVDDGPALSKDFLASHVESGNATGDNPRYTIAFSQKFDPKPPFQHHITISVPNPSGVGSPLTDTRIFTLTPHSIPPGISMISIPYFESAADSPSGQFRTAGEVLGNDVQLYQYVPTPATTPYITFSNTSTGTSTKPLAAAFQPPDALVPVEDASSTDTRPVGLGYFIKANSTIPVITYGTNFTTKAFRIPLHEGWNIIGDPFTFPVSFNSVTVETASGERIPIQQAVDRKLMQPFIYRYSNGEYQFRTLPDGILASWEGHWVYVTPANPRNISASAVLTLLVPPTGATSSSGRAAKNPTTRATGIVTTTSGQNNWTLRLIARSKTMTDSYNFIGVASRATDGEDNTKVPKPPMPSPFVALGMTRAANPGVLYAQDLRSPGGAKTWEMNVATDQPNADVVVNWPDVHNVPKNYRLTLTDKVSGQTIDMRNQSSYQFNSGQSAGSRSFVLTARPTALGGRALLSNVIVNQSRTDGRSVPTYEIGYNVSRDVRVEATILGFNGRVVAQIGTGRSVPSGDNRLVWNGRDNAGNSLSAGTYVLQMRVVTAENEVTRQTLPFVITGR